MAKGYFVPNGYMGFVPWKNRYILFDTESSYYEYVDERTEDYED